MKNLVPYSGNCISVHNQAIQNKKNEELKARLFSINESIESQFELYNAHFENNSLGHIVADATLINFKDDLLILYKYQSKIIRQVKQNITDQQVKTIVSTCQNCTIDSVSSLDHILPKSKFPEFIVHPYNLFPCCAKCNSYKSTISEDNLNQKFLNLYLDLLPKSQYLFVDVFLDSDNNFDFSFYLENKNSEIPEDFYLVIESHYVKLDLFGRFKLKSIEYVKELEITISFFKKKLPLNDIFDTLVDKINEEKNAFGDNYWKCILESELIRSPVFMDQFK